MTKESHPRTTRDALIIEAIGDIGKLIQRIEDLESVTVPLIVELENKLTDSISMVEKHASDKQVEFGILAEKEKKAFEEKLNASVTKTVNRMVNEVKREDGLSVRSQLLIALAIAIAGSAISIYGSYWMFGRDRDEQAALGRAVMGIWNQLDGKTKSMIEQAY
ncbi:MAG: hypothetical protein Q8S55_22125 [Methylococcaceae bacterium]|jgi:hypothetical protein|nr:hypothetical protein [Methylococcaceae bacterium]